MTVEEKIVVQASLPAVWSAITNIQQFEGIIKGITKIEILEQPQNSLIGLRWRETRTYFGKPASVDKQITEAQENHSYTARSSADGYIFLTFMEISTAPEGALLLSRHQTIPVGLMAKIKALPIVLFKPLLKKAIRQDLQDLKRAVEQDKS